MSQTHYTYLITNLKPTSTARYYIGFRSCYGNPENDSEYLGASTHIEFLTETKLHPENFEKIIIQIWPTRRAAHQHETQLIRQHQADSSELFYNKACASKRVCQKNTRPLCSVCNTRPAAINYIKNNITHFRKKCEHCLGVKKRKKPYVPRWKQKGYKQKNTCDHCGFRSKYPSQIVVYHINGDLNDAAITNLRSVCLNCVIEIEKQDLPWKQGDLIRDF